MLFTKRYPQLVDSEIVFNACIKSTTFLAEDSHAHYLAELVELLPNSGDVKSRLHARITRSKNPDEQDNMLEVISEFAKKGDSAARRLIRKVTTKNLRAKSLVGVSELLASMGKPGFRLLLKVIDELPSNHLSADQLSELLWRGTSKFSKRERLVEELSLTSRTAAILWEEIKREPEPRTQSTNAVTYRQLAEAWDGGDQEIRTLKYFADHASDEEFRRAAENLPPPNQHLDWYLRYLFRDRMYPLPPSTLFPLALGKSGRVAGAAFLALQQIKTSEVRTFGLQQMRTLRNGSLAVDLIAATYKPGDEERIRRCADRARPGLTLHQTLQTLLDLLEARPDIEPKYTDYVYEKEPCSFCRYRAVKLLVKQGRFDPDRKEECLYDTDIEIRKLARRARRREAPRR